MYKQTKINSGLTLRDYFLHRAFEADISRIEADRRDGCLMTSAEETKRGEETPHHNRYHHVTLKI